MEPGRQIPSVKEFVESLFKLRRRIFPIKSVHQARLCVGYDKDEQERIGAKYKVDGKTMRYAPNRRAYFDAAILEDPV